jgi:hypothetical protein
MQSLPIKSPFGDFMPKPVAAIIWESVGGDLSGFFEAYALYDINEKNFFRNYAADCDWQYFANVCAAYYEPGYSWLVALRSAQKIMHVDFIEALCCAIRANNTAFALRNKYTAWGNNEKTIYQFLGVHTDVSGYNPVLSEAIRYTIAAIDSKKKKTVDAVYNDNKHSLSCQDWSIIAMHIAEDDFAVLCGTFNHASVSYLRTRDTNDGLSAVELALLAANMESLRNLIKRGFRLGSMNNVSTALCKGNKKITEAISILWPIDWLMSDMFIQVNDEQAFELLVCLWRTKRTLPIAVYIQQYKNFGVDEFLRWVDTRVDNDDKFWDELGF